MFDFLWFKVDNGTVTLMGYAYHGALKSDAEQAVKRSPTVTAAINQIEELPVSMSDDGLRWKVYYAIYRDPFLSRYAPGGGLLWGHRHPSTSGTRARPREPPTYRVPAEDASSDEEAQGNVDGGCNRPSQREHFACGEINWNTRPVRSDDYLGSTTSKVVPDPSADLRQISPP